MCHIPKCSTFSVVSETAGINWHKCGEPRNPIWPPTWPPNTKSLLLKPKLCSGCSSVHAKCIFWLICTCYRQYYLFKYNKKHDLNIKGKIRGQMANFWSKNRALRRNRSFLKLLKRYHLLHFNLNNTPVIMANLNIIFLLKILNQYWIVSSVLHLPPPFDFNFSELMLVKLDKRQ